MKSFKKLGKAKMKWQDEDSNFFLKMRTGIKQHKN